MDAQHVLDKAQHFALVWLRDRAIIGREAGFTAFSALYPHDACEAKFVKEPPRVRPQLRLEGAESWVALGTVENFVSSVTTKPFSSFNDSHTHAGSCKAQGAREARRRRAAPSSAG